MISAGSLAAKVTISLRGTKEYSIPLAALSPDLQVRWYRQHGDPLPEELQPKKPVKAGKIPRPQKRLEEFTADQREQIGLWMQILAEWESYRSDHRLHKAAADAEFAKLASEKYGARIKNISVRTLYRRREALDADDLAGLVDNRGAWRKDQIDAPQQIRDAFEYCYLDEHNLPVAKCWEAARLMIKHDAPELLPQFPSIRTAYNWADSIPEAVAILARQGSKAYDDRCGAYIERIYDDMQSNDYWIADGHTIDVISRAEDGSERQHRLTLSAFIDARSGIYVGWVVTDNPCGDATLLALRKGIMRHGIPRHIYVDNGREYLNTDIGGLGHRAKKRTDKSILPTPILQRLGITMTNALPRNGRAKIIEREFRNFTFLSKLFDTYTGNNPATKPEKLKYHLKQGHIPTDGELIQIVNDMIEGYYNQTIYNGKVASDRGSTKMQVYQKHLDCVRKADEEELALMMMRSTRLQTIGRNGVAVTVAGKRIWYANDDMRMTLQGKKAFVRYDPEDMSTVRVYDENEAFLCIAEMDITQRARYGESKEDLSAAMAEQRRYKRAVRQQIEIQRSAYEDRHGAISMLDIFIRAARENRDAEIVGHEDDPGVIELVRAPEMVNLPAAVGDNGDNAIVVDRKRMIRNLERGNEK